MPNYDLGTAHGKIVVDYQDKGTGKAAKDLDSLKAKAAQLLKQFQETTKKYVSGARQMASEGSALLGRLRAAHQNLSGDVSQLIDDFDRFTSQFSAVTAALAVGLGLFTKTGNALAGLQGGVSILGQLRGALGRTPSGAEGFPSMIKRIMQLSSAIALFAGTTTLLATVTQRFRGVSAVTAILARFGGGLNRLAAPLHSVAGLARGVAFQILQLRFVKAVAKPLLIVAGALGAVGGTLHLIGGLAQSIKELLGLIGLLPAVAGAAVFGFAALKIATLGLSDAFKAWSDPVKFAEALKKLHPEAAKAVLAIKSLENTFKDAQKRLQGRLFDGLAQSIKDLGAKYIPILEERFGRVADSTNLAVKAIFDYLKTAEGVTQVKKILDNYANTWENLLAAFPHIVRALLDIVEVGSKVFKELTGGAEASAKKFEDFINKVANNGDLERWIRTGVQAFRQLWNIIKQVSISLGLIWKGLNGGEAKSFLAVLSDLTTKFNEFLRSAEGQRILKFLGDQFEKAWKSAQRLGDAFMKYVLPALEALMPLFTALSGGVIDGIVGGLQILSPLFIAIGKILTPIAPLLGHILAGMVTFAVVLLGLAAAAKIVGGAIFLLKVGLDTLKTAWAVAGFAGRLFTGNLKAQEKAALRLAGVLGKQAVKGIRTFVANSKLLKGLGIVAAFAAITVAADNLLPKDAGATFQPMRDDLTGFADFIRGVLDDPGAEMTKQWADIKDEFSHWDVSTSPIANWGRTVSDSFMNDFITPVSGFFSGLPGKISGWLSGVGQSFMTDFVGPIKSAGTEVGNFFTVTIPGFFSGLPAKISGWLSGVGQSFTTSLVDPAIALPGRIGDALSSLGTTLSTKASESWNAFKTATLTKFDELAGTTGTLPYRIGHALGALIGMGLKWANDTWNAFKTATIAKGNEIVTEISTWPTRFLAWMSTLGTDAQTRGTAAWESFKQATITKGTEIWAEVSTWPGRAVTALSTLAANLVIAAVNAWNSFKTSSESKGNEWVEWVRGLPQRAIDALQALGARLQAAATAHWEAFRRSAQAKIDQAQADAAALPGKVYNALAGLASRLIARAIEAWNQFRAQTVAGINTAIQFIAGLPGRAAAALGNLGSTLFNAGRSLIQGFINGIKSMVASVQQAASGLVAGVRSYFPFSPAKKGPFSGRGYTTYSGAALVKDFAAGMTKNQNLIQNAAAAAMSAAQLSGGFNLNGTAAVATVGAPATMTGWRPPTGGDGASAPVTNNYNVTVPAKDIAEMKQVSDFFGKVQQKARAGKAGK